jgi:hypothetical protein
MQDTATSLPAPATLTRILRRLWLSLRLSIICRVGLVLGLCRCNITGVGLRGLCDLLLLMMMMVGRRAALSSSSSSSSRRRLLRL